MLTIDIPQSSQQASEENEFTTYILDELKANGECNFIHFGAGFAMNWKEGWGKGTDSRATNNEISHVAYLNVITAFESRGYSIRYGNVIACGQYMTIKG
jgi:hypothetical protein